MSAVSNLGFKAHCLMGAVTIGAGAVAGGVFLSSVVTGALCGVTRHIINLTAMSMGLYDSKPEAFTVSRVAVAIFKGFAVQTVLLARGIAFTISPLAVVGFFVLSCGLHYAALQVIKANKECVDKCFS